MASERILIIEDEARIAQFIERGLIYEGYRVDVARDGQSGLTHARDNPPDLVILDLNLPGLDGLDVAREIRRKSDTPIIMLTARVEEADQLIGLELGADDYITKPFSPRIVVARVRALLRRVTTKLTTSPIVRVADLEIDFDAHTITRNGEEINLTPTEFNLLAVMAEQPGRAFSRLQLLEASQGATYEGYERTIDAHIKNLRGKLEIDPKEPRYIETVFGVGYRFAKN